MSSPSLSPPRSQFPSPISGQRSPSTSPARPDTPDLHDWEHISDDDITPQKAKPPIRHVKAEPTKASAAADGELKTFLPVRVEYAGGLTELIKTLAAHDTARAKGCNSTVSGLEALDSITKQLKRQLIDAVAPVAPAVPVGVSGADSEPGRARSQEKQARCEARRERAREAADQQASILETLARIEQRQLGQAVVVAERIPSAASLEQLRKDLRSSLAALVGDYPDFNSPEPVAVDADEIKTSKSVMSVSEAYQFVAEYCEENGLTPPHYSYYSRENAPSCHQFNGSLSGGVCTVHIGAAKDKHLGGVKSARGTGPDAATARGAAYLVLAHELQRQAQAGTETALSNGYRLTLAEAEAFIGWYCARFRFGLPSIEHQLSGPHDTLAGIWRATLSIAGRRIGMGEALDKDESTGRAQLDMVDYLAAQDPVLWADWGKEKMDDDSVKAELDARVEDVLKKWDATWNKPAKVAPAE